MLVRKIIRHLKIQVIKEASETAWIKFKQVLIIKRLRQKQMRNYG